MSMQRAKMLVSGLDWHHFGFAFFWATTFAGLTSSSAELAEGYQAYTWCKQIIVVVCLIAVAVLFRGNRRFAHIHAVWAGAMLATGSLLFGLAFFFGQFSLEAAVASGLLVGVSSGMFYLMWQSFYASEGASRTAICIPLSAALSVVLCILMSGLSPVWSMVCTSVVLPTLATVSLCRSLDEIVPYEVAPCTGVRAKALLKDMWKPVFCVSSIAFVWRIVDSMYQAGGGQSFAVLMAGMGCAVATVTCIELFSNKGFDVMALYQRLFPLVTGAFLLPTLLGVVWLPLVSGLVMFGFEVVNLLLIITCAVYASRNSLDSSVVYAWCIGPTLASIALGDVAGALVGRAAIYDFALVVDVLFVCVYLLSAALLLISFGKGRRAAGALVEVPAQQEKPACAAPEKGEDAAPARAGYEAASDEEPRAIGSQQPAASVPAAAPTFLQQVAAMELSDPLTGRECEIAELALQGNTVAAIARKLFISENTVRSHMKNIYRKLQVHSRQELIDLFS